MAYIRQNKFGGDLIEYGVVSALFEDIPESEVGVCSGAQPAFDTARQFIRGMVANQCKLAGCTVTEHVDKCWFGIRRRVYALKAQETK